MLVPGLYPCRSATDLAMPVTASDKERQALSRSEQKRAQLGSADTAALGSPCYLATQSIPANIKVWLSVGSYFPQGSAWTAQPWTNHHPDPLSSKERSQKRTQKRRSSRSHMAPGSVTAHMITMGCQKQPWPLGPNTQVLAQDLGHCDSVAEHKPDTHKFLVEDLH